VPKKGPDKFRAIADAREGNKSLDDWGVRYFTWQDFLMPLAIILARRAHASRHRFGARYAGWVPHLGHGGSWCGAGESWGSSGSTRARLSILTRMRSQTRLRRSSSSSLGCGMLARGLLPDV